MLGRRRRFGHKKLALCYALVRRYLPGERRVHPAHFDAHAAVTLVVALNGRGDYDGGYYVQPTSSAKSRCFVRLDAGGDAVCHTYKLRHGVAVRGGTRYSLVTWWKPSEAECEAGTATWYDRDAAKGDADACYNVAAHKMRLAGRYALHERRLVDAARDWYERAAMLGSCDAMARCGVLAESAGDHVVACRWFKLGAKRGSALAMRRLAAAFASGRGARRDVAASAELLHRAARDGDDAEAMADLASLHHAMGREKLARRWLRRAADRGQPDAACAIARRTLVADSATAGALEAAVMALRNAAASGSARAFVLLGRGHLGLCSPAARAHVPQSRRSAYECFARAASRGSREAEAFLARFLVGDGPRRDRDRALFLGALRKRQSDDARRRRLAPARLLLLAAA